MRKILITGVPGTGKTTIGDYLESNHGFNHINLEDPLGQPSKITGDKDSLEALIKDINTDLVITWGFGPDMPQHIQIINLILSNGATMFWFDGNRDAARKSFIKRGTVSEELLDIQMAKINGVNIKETFNPIYYDTFDKNGIFKNMGEIADEIIAKANPTS